MDDAGTVSGSSLLRTAFEEQQDDPVAPIPDDPDANSPFAAETPESVAGKAAAAPSCMPNGGCMCMGECRRCLQPFVGVEAVFLAPVHNSGGGGAD
ncbi:MAG TPA: hypothetical protein VMF30_14995, partial [Pirellulales bacterium]|nr:hypothetical protein [Pirellulales bacterium]